MNEQTIIRICFPPFTNKQIGFSVIFFFLILSYSSFSCLQTQITIVPWTLVVPITNTRFNIRVDRSMWAESPKLASSISIFNIHILKENICFFFLLFWFFFHLSNPIDFNLMSSALLLELVLALGRPWWEDRMVWSTTAARSTQSTDQDDTDWHNGHR